MSSPPEHSSFLKAGARSDTKSKTGDKAYCNVCVCVCVSGLPLPGEGKQWNEGVQNERMMYPYGTTDCHGKKDWPNLGEACDFVAELGIAAGAKTVDRCTMILALTNASRELEMAQDELSVGRQAWHFGTMLAHLRDIKRHAPKTQKRAKIYAAASKLPSLPENPARVNKKPAAAAQATGATAKVTDKPAGAASGAAWPIPPWRQGKPPPPSGKGTEPPPRGGPEVRHQDPAGAAKVLTSATTSTKRLHDSPQMLSWGKRMRTKAPGPVAPVGTTTPPRTTPQSPSVLDRAEAFIEGAPIKKIDASKGKAAKAKAKAMATSPDSKLVEITDRKDWPKQIRDLPFALPEGFKVFSKKRGSGASKDKEDYHYRAPVFSKDLRSIPEIRKALALEAD